MASKAISREQLKEIEGCEQREIVSATAAYRASAVWESEDIAAAVCVTIRTVLGRPSGVLNTEANLLAQQPIATLVRLIRALAGERQPANNNSNRRAAAEGRTVALEDALAQWQHEVCNTVPQSFATALAQTLVKYKHRLTEPGLDPSRKGRGSGVLPFAPIQDAVRKTLSPFEAALSALLTRVADTVVQRAQAQVRLSLEALTAAAMQMGSRADRERMSCMIAVFVRDRCPVLFRRARGVGALALREWYEAMMAETEAQLVRMLRQTGTIQRQRQDGSWAGSVEQAMLRACARLPNRLAFASRTVFQRRCNTAAIMMRRWRRSGGVGNAVLRFMQQLDWEQLGDAGRQQQEPRPTERQLMPPHSPACDAALEAPPPPRSRERVLRCALKHMLHRMRHKRSKSVYRGSAGNAAALHRCMAKATAAATTSPTAAAVAAENTVQLPRRFWKLWHQLSVARALRLYSAALVQELQNLATAVPEAAAPLAALPAICRLLRKRVVRAASAATTAAATATTASPTVAALSPCQLADHLAGRTEGGAWAVQQLANHCGVPVDVYVAGRNGTPFHIHPQAPHAPAGATWSAQHGDGGAPLRVAWSARHGFAAIVVTSRLPSRGGQVRTHTRIIPPRVPVSAAAAAQRPVRRRSCSHAKRTRPRTNPSHREEGATSHPAKKHRQ